MKGITPYVQWQNKGLVTNYREVGGGGLQNGKGCHVKFYPYEKGGAEQVLAIL